MPSNHKLLTDYNLVVDDPALAHFTSPSEDSVRIGPVACQIFVWITLANPETRSDQIKSRPIRALLDTGFNGGFFISDVQLGSLIGLKPHPESVIGTKKINRIGGHVDGTCYGLDIWAYPEIGGPRLIAPKTSPILLSQGMDVWTYKTQEGVDRSPPLLGIGTLNSCLAILTVDYSLRKCNLAATDARDE